MIERDKLIDKENEEQVIYVVLPTPMIDWVETFIENNIKFKSMIRIVNSEDLNPEADRYYIEEYDYEGSLF